MDELISSMLSIIEEVNMITIKLVNLKKLHQLELFVHQIVILKNNLNIKLLTKLLNHYYEVLYIEGLNDDLLSIPIKILRNSVLKIRANFDSDSDFEWDEEQTRNLITEILRFRKEIISYDTKYREQEKLNKKSLLAYVEQLSNHYARLLVIRIDLFYNFSVQATENLTLNDFVNDFKKLRELISNKKTCFDGLQGYAWAIEQGVDKGLHCHLLLVYDGSKHQNDSGLGLQVGNKWLSITNGNGAFFLCNTAERKAKFLSTGSLGIGMIFRNNPQSVNNLLQVASYLVNPEKKYQHPVANLGGLRTFGKGEFRVKWRRGIK